MQRDSERTSGTWRRCVRRAWPALWLALLLVGPGMALAQRPASPRAVDDGAVADSAPVDPEVVSIAVPGAGLLGGEVKMVTQVFRPPGSGPFPVVVFSHGRAGDAASRAKLKRPIPMVQVHYWLDRGFAIVAPVRPGYGETGGRDVELNGANFSWTGVCTSHPVYGRVAQAARNAIDSTLNWVRAQPWADAQRIVLVGQSVGGFATVSTAATHPQGVIGYVNFAGGAGGNPERAPGHSCDPQQLAELYADFGKTTTMPNLWIYAKNDQYWGPDVPATWHAGFAAGGSPTEFIHAPPVSDGDGHGLGRHRRSDWAPYLDKFLGSLGV